MISKLYLCLNVCECVFFLSDQEGTKWKENKCVSRAIISLCWTPEDLHFHTSPKSPHTLHRRTDFYSLSFFMCVFTDIITLDRWCFHSDLQQRDCQKAQCLKSNPDSGQRKQVQPPKQPQSKQPSPRRSRHREGETLRNQRAPEIRFSTMWICTPTGHRDTPKLPSYGLDTQPE